jgi:hypothetical protein
MQETHYAEKPPIAPTSMRNRITTPEKSATMITKSKTTSEILPGRGTRLATHSLSRLSRCVIRYRTYSLKSSSRICSQPAP